MNTADGIAPCAVGSFAVTAGRSFSMERQSVDKFDYFLQYLDELLSHQPEKLVDAATVGYWQAIRSVRSAAYVAQLAANRGEGQHGS